MRQLAISTMMKTFWLLLALLVAGLALQASVITGVSSSNDEKGIIVTVESDALPAYEQHMDYAEWMMMVDFPGFNLGPSVESKAYDLPKEVSPWVRGYRVEATPAGSRIVLVLGDKATPLNISMSRENNSLLIAIPAGVGNKPELISVPLGFRDPPARFWEVSDNGAYKVVPLTQDSVPAGAKEVKPTPAAVKPKAGDSSASRSYLVPRGIEEKPTDYSYADFAPKHKAEPSTRVAAETPKPVEPPAAEPVQEQPAEQPASPILQVLDESELEKLAEQPGEMVVQVDDKANVQPAPQEEASTSAQLSPEPDGEKPNWLPADDKREMDEASGRPWDGPRPWDVDQPRSTGIILPDREMLEMPLIESTRITYECVNAPLSQAISLMVASTPFNVIVDDTVSATTVTLSFRNTPLLEALDSITAANDLAYSMVHSTIIIGKREDIGRRLGGFITRTFQLDYADAESVKKVLVDNGLVTDKNVGVYNGEATTLSVNSGSSVLSTSEGGVNSGDIREIDTLVSTARRNTLVVTETKERMAAIERVVSEIDRKPRLITLETSIVEISETGLRNIGFSVPNSTATTVREETPAAADGIAMGLFLQTFYRDPLSVILTLNHQIELGNARILSRPNLSAVDGSQAIYFAGRMIPYIKKPGVSTGTTFSPPEVGFQAVGITLSFKPRVDREGNITMDVNPSVSTLLELVNLGSGATAPETQTRQVTTTIRIKDRETFVIAGLLSEEERNKLRKFPLLGDIPLFGKLFQNPSKTTERTEIMVFVTPTVHE
jgi:type II secretory pathway component GspD/PulD (secretin)